jgi:cytochrome c oxidase assembly factor CtaG
MNDGGSALARPHRRGWLAAVAVILIVICLVPPAGSYARRYVLAESLQFVLFAVAAPALLVLGAPWRALGMARLAGPDGRGVVGRLAGPRRHDPGSRRGVSSPGSRRGVSGPGFRRGLVALLAFIAAAIGWRLPVSVDALATQPGLAVLEMVTLAGAGAALWLELVESPPMLPRLSRPLRAFFAALAMWTIWILAYILGFSQAAWFTAYRHPGLSTVADQQIATGILWAIPALCFIPVVYVAALTWLRDTEDPDEGLRELVRAHLPQRGRWPRPPRGWDTHST